MPIEKVDLTAEERALAAISAFRTRVFIREWLINCFPMFSVPLLMILEGRRALHNRQFGGGKHQGGAFTFVQFLLLAAFVLTNVLFFVFPSPHISTYEIIFINIIWVLRNAVVATKWAYMSPKELADARTSYISQQWLSNNQIITGWMKPSNAVMEEQLKMAGVRQGIDLHKLNFKVEGVKRTGDKYNATDFSDVQWNAYDLALDALLKSRDRLQAFYTSISGMCFVLGVVHALIPVIARGAQGFPLCGGNDDSEWAPCVFTAEAAFLNWFLVFSNVAFITIGTLDYIRRVFALEYLNDLLVKSTIIDGKAGNKSAMLKSGEPTIDLSVPNNIAVWCAMRKVLPDVGVTFQKRINVYATLFSAYVIALVIMIAVAVYAPAGRLVIQVDFTLILFVIIDVGIFMTATFVIVLLGSRMNFMSRRHAYHCSLKRCEVYEFIAHHEETLEPMSQTRLELTGALLATAVDIIRASNDVTVSRTLGFESSGQIAGVFAAFASTGIGIAAKAIQSIQL